jgi:hypothetical protein
MKSCFSPILEFLISWILSKKHIGGCIYAHNLATWPMFI